jgi:hypothetical protein
LAGRNPAEAVRNFVHPLQRTISCISKAVLLPKGHDPNKIHALTLGEPVALRGGEGLTLSVSQRYRVVRASGKRGPWKASTVAYIYALGNSKGEIIAYHWQPDTQPEPHLHARQLGKRRHIPSGRVSLEQVIRLGIEEYGVKPIRDDWDAVLSAGHNAFVKWRTWPKPSA